MRGENGRQAGRAWGRLVALAAALALGACSSTSLDNILKSSERNATPAPASTAPEGVPPAVVAAANNDTPCPEVKVRTGAATLMVGSNPRATGEPSPLDMRYQGSIVNTARECHLNAGILTVKVGVEGRVITGPAGGPGSLTVPLRIAVVHEGIAPKTVVSKFASIPVTIANAVDRVTFTHVDPDVSFPMPRPASALDSYVVYVGFDPQGEQPKKPVRTRRR